MDRAEITSKIRAIIAHVTGIAPEEITDDASFVDDLAMDSLSLLEIGVDVDYEFKLGVPEEVLAQLGSLREAVALAEERLAEKVA